MCVESHGENWERPARADDLPILNRFFKGIDFESLLSVMSRDNAKPLTTDLALIGAMIETNPDELGMRFVPFCALGSQKDKVVKLPVMESIVGWFENSALGTDMWQHASDWAEERYSGRFHFAMNCGCGLVASEAKQNGNWSRWQQNFNASRSETYGETHVTKREEDSVEGLDISSAQLNMWSKIREALSALPA